MTILCHYNNYDIFHEKGRYLNIYKYFMKFYENYTYGMVV